MSPLTPTQAPSTEPRVIHHAAIATAEGLRSRLQARAARPSAVKAGDLIDDFMDMFTGRDKTIAQRLSAWKAMIGDIVLEDIDVDLIAEAREELRAQPALNYKGVDYQGREIFKAKTEAAKKRPATINKYMAAISAVFTWAIRERRTPRGWAHPCRGIRRLEENNARVRFLSPEERDRLLACTLRSKYPRMRALIVTALLTGARRGELLSLRWRDVDLEAGVARLHITKNGDRRVLVLLPQVVEVLKPFKSEDGARFVFGSLKSRYQRPADISSAWRELVTRAKLTDFKFHDTRHCFASYLAQDGAPLNLIADALGHRSLEMSRRYSHLTTQSKGAAMQRALGAIELPKVPAPPPTEASSAT